MSLPERIAAPMTGMMRSLLVAALVGLLTMISACTVRPLYGQPATAGVMAGEAALLASIAVKPAASRHEQEVRNHLIFLFGGGAGEPANPAFMLALSVASRVDAASIQQVGPVGEEDSPTAGTTTLIATYQLSRAGTGEVVASGQRQVSAAFDRPSQLYAVARAERDAQNRAARELAELIRLAIAQDLRVSAAQ